MIQFLVLPKLRSYYHIPYNVFFPCSIFFLVVLFNFAVEDIFYKNQQPDGNRPKHLQKENAIDTTPSRKSPKTRLTKTYFAHKLKMVTKIQNVFKRASALVRLPSF